MKTPSQLHNELAPRIVKTIITEMTAAGSDAAGILVTLQSVVLGVLFYAHRHKTDNLNGHAALDVMCETVHERLTKAGAEETFLCLHCEIVGLLDRRNATGGAVQALDAITNIARALGSIVQKIEADAEDKERLAGVITSTVQQYVSAAAKRTGPYKDRPDAAHSTAGTTRH